MRRKFLLTSLLLLLAISVVAIFSDDLAQAQGVSNEAVIIGFKKFPGNSEQALVQRAGGKIKYSYHLIPAIAASVPSVAIKGLRHNPNVIYVEEDTDIFLNDELTDNWGITHINADQAWSINKGAGIHVSIVDTGIDMDHPDLVANISGGVNFVSGKGKDKTPDPYAWNDGHGHGTHCAGIVAADDNGTGVIGVAPDASLYGVKVLDDRGRGKASDFIAGLEWSVDGPDGIHGNEDDAEIISISLRMYDTIEHSVTAACDAAYAAGLLLISSAGNTSGGSVTPPAGHPSVMAVSAIDASNTIAWFSADGPEVELTAPGVGIYSTYRNGGYTDMDGTSMSCPHVAGAAALAWATGYYSHCSAVRLQLKRTAIPLGTPPLPNEQYGYGLVDALSAVALPDPGFVVEVSEDKGDYLEDPQAEVTLTIILRDEFGNPIANIGSVIFGAALIGYNNPSIVIDRNEFLAVTPTEIAGTYQGSIWIGDLDVEEDTRYWVIVTAEDPAVNRFGSGRDDFFIRAITGNHLIVDLQTDKSVYTIGEKIYTTVTVTNESGDPIEGAMVYYRITCASGRFHYDDKYTDADGIAQFEYKIKNPDGTGTWRVSTTVEMPGHMDGSDTVWIEVK